MAECCTYYFSRLSRFQNVIEKKNSKSELHEFDDDDLAAIEEENIVNKFTQPDTVKQCLIYDRTNCFNCIDMTKVYCGTQRLHFEICITIPVYHFS